MNIIEIYKKCKDIFNSNEDWEFKYDEIFKTANPIIKERLFDWYDPDTTYEEDVTYFMNAFDSYIEEQNQKSPFEILWNEYLNYKSTYSSSEYSKLVNGFSSKNSEEEKIKLAIFYANRIWQKTFKYVHIVGNFAIQFNFKLDGVVSYISNDLGIEGIQTINNKKEVAFIMYEYLQKIKNGYILAIV